MFMYTINEKGNPVSVRDSGFQVRSSLVGSGDLQRKHPGPWISECWVRRDKLSQLTPHERPALISCIPFHPTYPPNTANKELTFSRIHLPHVNYCVYLIMWFFLPELKLWVEWGSSFCKKPLTSCTNSITDDGVHVQVQGAHPVDGGEELVVIITFWSLLRYNHNTHLFCIHVKSCHNLHWSHHYLK